MLKNFYFVSFLIALFFTGCNKSDDPSTQNLLSVSTGNLTLNGSVLNSKDSFNIQSNVNWTISVSPSSASWLAVNNTNGNGNSKIYVSVTQINTTGADRVAQITVAASGNPAVPGVTIQINQTQSNTIWSKLYGGSLNDQFSNIIKTSDGGYVLAGVTNSNDGDLIINKGLSDLWMVKLNANGAITWSKTMGGSNYDIGHSVVESSDGGYVFVGSSSSNDGDVTGSHGSGDIWVIKLDVNGNLVWKKTYGGSNYESPGSLTNTTNGDFIIVGSTQSNDGDVSGLHGSAGDVWVLRINSIGNIVWQKCLGGTGVDIGGDVLSSGSSGYIISTVTYSLNGDVTNSYGSSDMWIVKLNDLGNIIWQKSYGGSAEDGPSSILSTSDGGYLITGGTTSNNGHVSGNHGDYDGWVIKIDGNGVLNWQKCYGGSGYDRISDLCPTSSGGYMLAASTSSNNGDVSGGYIRPDNWLIEMDVQGNILWQKCVGGNPPSLMNNLETCASIFALPNNEFLTLGNTSSIDGDVSGQHGSVDGWLYKFRR